MGIETALIISALAATANTVETRRAGKRQESTAKKESHRLADEQSRLEAKEATEENKQRNLDVRDKQKRQKGLGSLGSSGRRGTILTDPLGTVGGDSGGGGLKTELGA